jgi:hypothetical protein
MPGIVIPKSSGNGFGVLSRSLTAYWLLRSKSKTKFSTVLATQDGEKVCANVKLELTLPVVKKRQGLKCFTTQLSALKFFEILYICVL